MSHLYEDNKYLVKYVHMLARMDMTFEDSLNCGFMVRHNSEFSLVVEVKSKKHRDQSLMKFKESVLVKLNE